MINFMKKNWFVSVMVVILAVSSCYYIYDTNKGKLKGKSSNGEDVVYSVNGEDTTSSSLYEEMFKTTGEQTAYMLLQKAVASQSVETTDEMKKNAANQAASIIADFQKNNPGTADIKLNTSLRQLGYSGKEELENYLIDYQKSQKIIADYAKSKTEELKIRNISYILIKHQDGTPSDTPTEDEAMRMKAVDDELASNGNDFAATATKYSEDTTSAPSGGELGTIDKNTSNLDANFLNAALSLSEGEISDWVKSNQFGYFKIKVNAATEETLSNLPTDPYLSLVSSYDTTLTNTALWAKANELGLDFGENVELAEKLKNFMGIQEDSSMTEESK